MGSGYFSLSIYPPSVPVNLELIHNGVQQSLLEAGALFKPCFCGPCFGAGDVPANNGLSIRHTTRNFPNREGSKPGDGQLSGVVLMDARSIAATARNHGVLTPATEVSYVQPKQGKRTFDQKVYDRRVYFGFGHPQPEAELKFGPNIAEWPPIPALADNMLMQVASVLRDPVTTTDELIPSGETSSYRSNPLKLASFALSRRGPRLRPPGPGHPGPGHRPPGRRPRPGGPGRPGGLWPEGPGPGGLPDRLGDLRQQARRRLRPGAGRLLPAGAGRVRQHLL